MRAQDSDTGQSTFSEQLVVHSASISGLTKTNSNQNEKKEWETSAGVLVGIVILVFSNSAK